MTACSLCLLDDCDEHPRPTPPAPFPPLLVTGCGVSMLCRDKQSVLDWVGVILEKGGTPEFQPFHETV